MDADKKIKFTIFLLTYNRHELLRKTLDSIFSQTYEEYQILLYDNGSYPSVENIAKEYADDRLKYFRSENNVNGSIHAENAIEIMNGTHFIFLADDDLITKDTFKIVAEVLSDNKNIEILQVGFVYYNQNEDIFYENRNNLDTFNGELEHYDALDVAFYHFDSWGIGCKRPELKAPRMSHSSGLFISKELIDKTKLKQKELFVDPFGDVGMTGALFYTSNLYFLDLPLVVIGEGHPRDMDGALSGNRNKWRRYLPCLQHTPLKSSSFVNMGVESNLKVIYRNNIDKIYSTGLRPNFFYNHLKSVVSDSPWTMLTIYDFLVCVYYMLKSIISFPKYVFSVKTIKLVKCEIERLFTVLLRNNYAKIKRSDKTFYSMTDFSKFNDTEEFMSYVNNNYILKKYRVNSRK